MAAATAQGERRRSNDGRTEGLAVVVAHSRRFLQFNDGARRDTPAAVADDDDDDDDDEDDDDDDDDHDHDARAARLAAAVAAAAAWTIAYAPQRA